MPVRVQLEGLTEKDLLKILTGPKCSLTKQYVELMATEGVKLTLEVSKNDDFCIQNEKLCMKNDNDEFFI